MEIKVTIALDKSTHDVLNRLIAAISQIGTNATTILTTVNDTSSETATQQTSIPASHTYAEEAVKSAPWSANAESEEPVEPKQKTATKPASDGESAHVSTTVEDLRALAADVKAKTVSIDAVKALLTKYSAKNITGVPADKRDAFADELKRLL